MTWFSKLYYPPTRRERIFRLVRAFVRGVLKGMALHPPEPLPPIPPLPTCMWCREPLEDNRHPTITQMHVECAIRSVMASPFLTEPA